MRRALLCLLVTLAVVGIAGGLVLTAVLAWYVGPVGLVGTAAVILAGAAFLYWTETIP